MALNKGKGKATQETETEPRRRAVADGQVLLSWSDLGTEDTAQRSYDQAKFEDSYRWVLNDLLPEATAKKQRDKEQAALNASKLSSPEATAALERILKELDVSKSEAEAALVAANLDLKQALEALLKAPQPSSSPGQRGSSAL